MTRRPLDLTGIMAPVKSGDKPSKKPDKKRTKPFKLTARRLLQYPYQLGGFFGCLLLFLLVFFCYDVFVCVFHVMAPLDLRSLQHAMICALQRTKRGRLNAHGKCAAAAPNVLVSV